MVDSLISIPTATGHSRHPGLAAMASSFSSSSSSEPTEAPAQQQRLGCDAHPDAPTWRMDGFGPLAKRTHIGCWRCHLARVRFFEGALRRASAGSDAVLLSFIHTPMYAFLPLLIGLCSPLIRIFNQRPRTAPPRSRGRRGASWRPPWHGSRASPSAKLPWARHSPSW